MIIEFHKKDFTYSTGVMKTHFCFVRKSIILTNSSKRGPPHAAGCPCNTKYFLSGFTDSFALVTEPGSELYSSSPTRRPFSPSWAASGASFEVESLNAHILSPSSNPGLGRGLFFFFAADNDNASRMSMQNKHFFISDLHPWIFLLLLFRAGSV